MSRYAARGLALTLISAASWQHCFFFFLCLWNARPTKRCGTRGKQGPAPKLQVQDPLLWNLVRPSKSQARTLSGHRHQLSPTDAATVDSLRSGYTCTTASCPPTAGPKSATPILCFCLSRSTSCSASVTFSGFHDGSPLPSPRPWPASVTRKLVFRSHTHAFTESSEHAPPPQISSHPLVSCPPPPPAKAKRLPSGSSQFWSCWSFLPAFSGCLYHTRAHTHTRTHNLNLGTDTHTHQIGTLTTDHFSFSFLPQAISSAKARSAAFLLNLPGQPLFPVSNLFTPDRQPGLQGKRSQHHPQQLGQAS